MVARAHIVVAGDWLWAHILLRIEHPLMRDGVRRAPERRHLGPLNDLIAVTHVRLDVCSQDVGIERAILGLNVSMIVEPIVMACLAAVGPRADAHGMGGEGVEWKTVVILAEVHVRSAHELPEIREALLDPGPFADAVQRREQDRDQNGHDRCRYEQIGQCKRLA